MDTGAMAGAGRRRIQDTFGSAWARKSFSHVPGCRTIAEYATRPSTSSRSALIGCESGSRIGKRLLLAKALRVTQQISQPRDMEITRRKRHGRKDD